MTAEPIPPQSMPPQSMPPQSMPPQSMPQHRPPARAAIAAFQLIIRTRHNDGCR
jgi:hypothetical protein